MKRLLRRMFPMKLSEALKLVQAQYAKTSKTSQWYEQPIHMLMDIVGDIPITEVTEEHLREWQYVVEMTPKKLPSSDGEEKRSLWTQDSYKRAMRAFWNHLIKLRHLSPPSPAVVLSFPTLPDNESKQLSDRDVENLLNVAKRDIRDYAMVQVLRASGIRVGGLASMKYSTLEIEKVELIPEGLTDEEYELLDLARSINAVHLIQDQYLYVYAGKFLVLEKGRRGRKQTRYAFMNHEACIAVLKYLDTRTNNAPDQLWLNNKGKPLSSAGIYQAFHRVARDAGVDASPHDLRHTFAFNLIENDVNPKMVAKLMGHRDFQTTLKIYYNPRLSDIERTYRRLNNLPE